MIVWTDALGTPHLGSEGLDEAIVREALGAWLTEHASADRVLARHGITWRDRKTYLAYEREIRRRGHEITGHVGQGAFSKIAVHMSAEDRAEIERLFWNDGMTRKAIAKLVGCSYGRVAQIIRETQTEEVA